MTLADKIYIDEVGKPIKIDCGESLATATAQEIAVLKPDGTETTWTASVVDTNFLQHDSEVGELDQAGNYLLMANVTLGGELKKGNTTILRVYGDFK